MGLLSKIADCTKSHILYECEEGSWQVFSACRCFLVDLVRPQNPRPFKFNRTHLHEGAIKIRMYVLFLFGRGVSRRRPKVKVCRSCSMKERKKGPTDDRTTHPPTDVWTRILERDFGVLFVCYSGRGWNNSGFSHDVTLLLDSLLVRLGSNKTFRPSKFEAFKVESSVLVLCAKESLQMKVSWVVLNKLLDFLASIFSRQILLKSFARLIYSHKSR